MNTKLVQGPRGPDGPPPLGVVSIIFDTSAVAMVPEMPLVDRMLQIAGCRHPGELEAKGTPTRGHSFHYHPSGPLPSRLPSEQQSSWQGGLEFMSRDRRLISQLNKELQGKKVIVTDGTSKRKGQVAEVIPLAGQDFTFNFSTRGPGEQGGRQMTVGDYFDHEKGAGRLLLRERLPGIRLKSPKLISVVPPELCTLCSYPVTKKDLPPGPAREELERDVLETASLEPRSRKDLLEGTVRETLRLGEHPMLQEMGLVPQAPPSGEPPGRMMTLEAKVCHAPHLMYQSSSRGGGGGRGGYGGGGSSSSGAGGAVAFNPEEAGEWKMKDHNLAFFKGGQLSCMTVLNLLEKRGKVIDDPGKVEEPDWLRPFLRHLLSVMAERGMNTGGMRAEEVPVVVPNEGAEMAGTVARARRAGREAFQQPSVGKAGTLDGELLLVLIGRRDEVGEEQYAAVKHCCDSLWGVATQVVLDQMLTKQMSRGGPRFHALCEQLVLQLNPKLAGGANTIPVLMMPQLQEARRLMLGGEDITFVGVDVAHPTAELRGQVPSVAAAVLSSDLRTWFHSAWLQPPGRQQLEQQQVLDQVMREREEEEQRLAQQLEQGELPGAQGSSAAAGRGTGAARGSGGGAGGPCGAIAGPSRAAAAAAADTAGPSQSAVDAGPGSSRGAPQAGAAAGAPAAPGSTTSSSSSRGRGRSFVVRQDTEIISCLGDMVVDMVGTGPPPRRLLVLRDGVSLSQMRSVMDNEVQGIKRAFQIAFKFEPEVTYVIVNKSDRTRLLPTDKSRAQVVKNNVLPGTLVDHTITMYAREEEEGEGEGGCTEPPQFDFYLSSQAGLKGTNRVACYRVLSNELQLKPEKLYHLVFMLCFVYWRSTRAAKLPAPVYYADVLAGRVQLWVNHGLVGMEEPRGQQGEGGAVMQAQKVPLTRQGLFFL